MIACKDCIHCESATFGMPNWIVRLFGTPKENWRLAKCHLRPRVKIVHDWGNGYMKEAQDYDWCSVERQFGECGEDAKNFQPRE